MRLYFLTMALLLGVVISFYSCAQSKKTSETSVNDYANLIEADMQRTLPGRPEQEISTRYSFIIKWKYAAPPETFFWKGTDSWMICRIEKLAKKREKHPADSNPFTSIEIAPDKIKKGDTLLLTPIKEGKFPIPSEIPSKLENVILFKTNKSNWMHLAVKTFTRLPDIILH